MNKLLFMILVALTVLCFACDEDKDKDKPQTTDVCKCDDGSDCPDSDKAKCPVKPVCVCDDSAACPDGNKDKCAADPCKDKAENDDCGENKACQKDGDKLVCKDKAAPCMCDDNTACPDGDKDKCAKMEPKCEGDSPACNPACEAGSDCICRDAAWACVPVDIEDKCDPKCSGDKKCECTNDVCSCVDVNPCNSKSEGDECGENKTCQMNGEVLVCKDKPVLPPTCDPVCNDESEMCKCEGGTCGCVPKSDDPDPNQQPA